MGHDHYVCTLDQSPLCKLDTEYGFLFVRSKHYLVLLLKSTKKGQFFCLFVCVRLFLGGCLFLLLLV